MSVTDLVNGLPSSFHAERANNLQAKIQIEVTGEDAGEWYILIHGDTCEVISGRINSPDLILTATSAVILDVFSGKADPFFEYMKGHIQFSGNMALANKVIKLFQS
jgi:putative sterol carrier protein